MASRFAGGMLSRNVGLDERDFGIAVAFNHIVSWRNSGFEEHCTYDQFCIVECWLILENKVVEGAEVSILLD